MAFSLLLMGAILAAPRLSASDQEFVARINNAASHLSDRKAAFLQFNTEVTPADAQRCRQLQNRVAPNNSAYVELSFVQAYYGIDYSTNLQRVLRPYRLWRTDVHRWSKEYPSGEENSWTDLDATPLLLNLLYLRHHDQKSLGTWLDLRLDGSPAESNDVSLGELWDRHKRDMLLACDGHPERIDNLTSALMYRVILSGKEAQPYTHGKRRFAATLNSLVASTDPHVSRPARKLREKILHNHLWDTSR